MWCVLVVLRLSCLCFLLASCAQKRHPSSAHSPGAVKCQVANGWAVWYAKYHEPHAWGVLQMSVWWYQETQMLQMRIAITQLYWVS